jgi:hypothetical protein
MQLDPFEEQGTFVESPIGADNAGQGVVVGATQTGVEPLQVQVPAPQAVFTQL